MELAALQRHVEEKKPRLGFAGVGWIGRHRMEAIARSGCAEVAAIADPNPEMIRAALEIAPGARCVDGFEALLAGDLDGVVIATPNALHAEQSIRALEAGKAVFCQKPLARTADETLQVLEAARRSDRLLGVDLSYRYTEGMQRIREIVAAGEIGDVYAVDVVFHNAYGPGKAWSFDPRLAGGGCLIDLGVHLVDLALWTLGYPEIERATGRLLGRGRPLADPATEVEDYAVGRLDLATGAVVSMACSWNLAAGRDAVIEASFYGTRGGLSMRNLDGSYFDFVAERFRERNRETIASPPDDWGGRAAVAWAERLGRSRGYDPEIEHILPVAGALDALYGRSQLVAAAGVDAGVNR